MHGSGIRQYRTTVLRVVGGNSGLCRYVRDWTGHVHDHRSGISPGQTIYGHYVFDGVSGDFCWAANWDDPYVIPAGGAIVELSFSASFQSCYVYSAGPAARRQRIGTRVVAHAPGEVPPAPVRRRTRG